MFFGVVIICIIAAEFLLYKRNVEYIGLLRRLDAYLADFRHVYCRMLSVSAAFEETDNTGLQKVKELELYRLFTLLCEIVRENGDTVSKEGSVFLKNLSVLRLETNAAIRSSRERRYGFSGMVLVCCAPLILAYAIEKWAVSGIPGMDSFYVGMGGRIIRILLLLSVIGGYIYIIQKREEPKLFRAVKRGTPAEAEEIKNLRSIIIMLKEIKGITVIRLIEIMCGFSEIFKGLLDKCLNEYGFYGREAIRNLRSGTENEMFKGLAENLLNCDANGISNAFEEISIEQESFMAEQELLKREVLKKEVTYAYIVSMLPMCIVVVMYLTLPFILESMTMLEEVINSMKNI